MTENEDRFIPEIVDEQIDRIYRDTQHSESATPDENLIQDLYTIHSGDEEILAGVWTHLVQRMEQKHDTGQLHLGHIRLMHKQPYSLEGNQHMSRENSHTGRLIIRNVTLIVAVCIATLLVGSLVIVFQLAHRSANSNLGSSRSHASLSSTVTAQPVVLSPSGIYVGSDNGVYRVDIKTGKVIWSYPLPPYQAGNAGSLSPRIAFKTIIIGNTIIVGVHGGDVSDPPVVLALDARNGSSIWNFTESYSGWVSDLQLSAGTIYVNVGKTNSSGASPDNIVYALNPATGAITNTYDLDNTATQISIVKNVVYFNSEDGPMAFSLSARKQLWHTSIPGLDFSSIQVKDGVFYALASKFNKTGGSSSGQAYALDANSGRLLWQSEQTDDYVFDMTITNNVVYFGSQNQWLYAYDAQSGKKLWSYKVGGDINHAPAVNNGVVYVGAYVGIGTFDGVMALNASTGAEMWQAIVAGGDMITPASANGVVYASNGSSIYTFNASDGSKISHFVISRLDKNDPPVRILNLQIIP